MCDERAGSRPRRHHRRVDIARRRDGRVDQIGTESLHLCDLAREVACDVEVVDCHVAKQPARDIDIGDRRRRRIAAGDDELLKLADLASGHPVVRRAEGRVEATVEADHYRGVEIANVVPALLDLRHVERDRLFAKDRLPGPGGGRDELDMRVRAGRDENGIDLRIPQNFLDGGGCLHSEFRRHAIGGGGHHVED